MLSNHQATEEEKQKYATGNTKVNMHYTIPSVMRK